MYLDFPSWTKKLVVSSMSFFSFRCQLPLSFTLLLLSTYLSFSPSPFISLSHSLTLSLFLFLFFSRYLSSSPFYLLLLFPYPPQFHFLLILDAQALVRFAAHIQQVDMESNGKRVSIDGTLLPYECGVRLLIWHANFFKIWYQSHNLIKEYDAWYSLSFPTP